MKNYFLKIIFSIAVLFSGFNAVCNSVDSLLNLASVETDKLKKAFFIERAAVKLKNHFPDSALLLFNKSLAIRLEAKDPVAIGGGYSIIAQVYAEQGKHKMALQYADSAVTYYVKSKNILGLVHCYNIKGGTYLATGNFEMAAEMFYKALNYCLVPGQKEMAGECLFILYNLAYLLNQMDKHEDALIYAMREYDQAHLKKINREIAYACSIILDTYNKMHQVKKGIIFLNEMDSLLKIKDDVKTNEDDYLPILSALNHGNIYMDENNYPKAIQYFSKAVELNKDLIDQEVQCMALNNLAQAYCNTGKYNDAKKTLEESIRISYDNNTATERVHSLKLLSEISASQKDFKSAYQYNLLYKRLSDSLLNEKSLNSLSNSEVKFRTVEHTQQIELLGKEKKLQEAETSRQKNFRNTVILVFILAIVLATFAFYRFRQKVKQKQEAERTRISRDLHDDVGATLGSISIYSEVAKNKSSVNGEMNEVLEKIGDSSREMLEKMNDIVWAVNPKNDNAEELIHRMKNFAAAMLTPQQINFSFEPDSIAADQLKLGMQQRKNIFLIYKEALHNIIKYADAKEVKVKVNVNRKDLIVLIHDDGKGFSNGSASAYNGNGIKNMKERAIEIGGKFEIHSEINNGTQISLNIPI